MSTEQETNDSRQTAFTFEISLATAGRLLLGVTPDTARQTRTRRSPTTVATVCLTASVVP